MGSESRQFPRRDIKRTVCINVPMLTPGTLLDVSQTGARLSVANPNELPDEFMLALNPELHRWCCIIWRKDHEIGVQFKGTPEKYLEWFPRKQEKRAGS
jgi:PilZ domain